MFPHPLQAWSTLSTIFSTKRLHQRQERRGNLDMREAEVLKNPAGQRGW